MSGIELIQIGGAGPAGLAAAITLARAGRRVLVHEAQGEVGYRFDGDFQGLENWSAQQDVLDQLRELGITMEFAMLPCDRGYAFDAWGERYELAGSKTLFYLVERGPGAGTLDTAMLEQARGLGVEVRFNSRLDCLEEGMNEARALPGQLAALGLELDKVSDELERQGVQKFIEPYERLLAVLARRATELAT